MYPEIANNTLQTKKGERGAALITVLFISTLLLAAGGALILITGTASRTAVDSTAEMQAYYSAEAGLETSLNVLRGNIAPNASMPAGTKISFRNAVDRSTSNLSGDTSLRARLSGWLNYSYTPSGAGNPDRVPLTASYTPLTGLAYSVDVSDPDNTPVPSGEPTRLLLRVTGYGPKSAVKRLELVVRRSNVEYAPPAMLMMRGSNDGTPVAFNIGDSNAKDYSGHDRSGSSILPTFGATSDGDKTIEATADSKETVIDPKAASFSDPSLPVWLRSADEARTFLEEQKANAIEQGRYFTSFSGYSGTVAAPAFTFVDGDCVLDGGAGLLIVTGNLEMNGNPNFTGLILVLGNGSVNRDGSGNGDIYGAMAVAHFDPNGTGGFLGATFNTNGSGTSTMQYDSNAVRTALNLSGPRVLGVHEY
jgi:hypothetical protein